MLLLALDMVVTLVLPLLVVGVVFLVLFLLLLLLLLGGVRVRGVSMWSFGLLFILVVGLVGVGLLAAGLREDRVVEKGNVRRFLVC